MSNAADHDTEAANDGPERSGAARDERDARIGSVAAPAEPPAAAGACLKWARERAGLTVGDIAARLRLHPTQVRALEDEDFKRLPEAAYVRGFVRSYARIVDVPVEPLLADLATKLGPPSTNVIERMTRERDYSPVRAATHEQVSRRIVLWGALLLLVALGVVGWYATHASGSASALVPVTRPAPVAAAPVPTPAPAPAEPAVTPTAAPGATAEPASASSAATATPAASEPAPLLEPMAPAPLLKLRFSGASWAEVKDAEGKTLHSRRNEAGDEFVIEGTPPFYVVLGDANKATVEVRGESIDLAQHTRQNVARFTVN